MSLDSVVSRPRRFDVGLGGPAARLVDTRSRKGYDCLGRMVSLEVATHCRTGLVDITTQVQSAVAQSQVKHGMCFVYVPHTTAAVTVNEAFDPAVAEDITATLSKLVPAHAGYTHTEGNSDAHIKATLVGSCQAVPVEGGKLFLGRWQGIFLCEFDGPRQRRCHVQVINQSGG